MKSLINKKAVKELALNLAKNRYHKFTRVSKEFLEQMEFNLRGSIQRHIEGLPSKGKTITAFLLAMMITSSAFALTDAQGIQIVMAEARGEGYAGMLAVGEVARRRNSTKPFCGFKVKINEPKWVWDLAEKAWKDSATSDTTLGATHFESTDFPVPAWAKSMKKAVQIKKHIFYKGV